ncbi:Cro/Cl family transcriptional regulator [Rahnella sp. RcJ3]|nr:Cro/Cl family transcriptional regulator [Rahnella sp. RcJ3]
MLVPALVEALLPNLARSVGINTAESVTVRDFASSAGISERLVWQWLEDGVLLAAPTKDTSKSRSTKKSTVTKSRTLINMTAWRAKQHQQAKDCKYIR